MRLKVSKSKNAASLYVIKSTYINGIHSSKIVEKLGTYDELLEKLGGQDPYKWAKKYIAELNKQEKENRRKIMAPYSPNKLIPKGEQRYYNGGYLFLQKIYYELGLDKMDYHQKVQVLLRLKLYSIQAYLRPDYLPVL